MVNASGGLRGKSLQIGARAGHRGARKKYSKNKMHPSAERAVRDCILGTHMLKQ